MTGCSCLHVAVQHSQMGVVAYLISKGMVCFDMLIKFPVSQTLTLSLPRVPKIKIQGKSEISFCKKLKYKQCHMKVLLTRFLLNGHTIGFHPQTQKLESPFS